MILSSFLSIFFCAPASSTELLVAAATDLTRLEQPLAEGFRKVTGERVRFVLGSSGMLARQIESGAPYDVYLSANERFVSDLAAQAKIDPKSVRVYALGRIATWSKRGIALGTARRIAIANPAHAPYGVAAKQALEKQGLWTQVESRIVYGQNVRQALQFAESGNAEVAITAWSLVFDRGGMLLPAELHAPLRQAAGLVASSSQRGPGGRFLDFLTGAQGQALLARYGLFPVR